MKEQTQQAIRLLGAACLSIVLTTGCGASPAFAPAGDQTVELTPSAAPGNSEPSQTEPGTKTDPGTNAEPGTKTDSGTNTEPGAKTDSGTAQGGDNSNAGGKWHVLPPDVAAAVDADFEGTVWKIADSSFYIAPIETEIMDGGLLSIGGPSPDADIPDSELVLVVPEADALISIRTIYDGGARHEDSEAAFQDLEKEQMVSLKGRFENDVFYAAEIRIARVVQ